MGIVLFAALCGYLPFDHPDTQTLYDLILDGKFKCPDYLSSEAQNLLKGILNINPSFRYTIQEIRLSAFYKRHSRIEEPRGLLP